MIDGDLLPQHPLAPGATLDIPLLTGTNMNEYDMMRLEPNPAVCNDNAPPTSREYMANMAWTSSKSITTRQPLA